MANIPLILRLKKQTHRNLALAQDIIVKELYKIFDEAVLHGGTAIWRCYKGNRFSEDIDAYIPRDVARLRRLFDNLEKKDFRILKKKIGARSVFSRFNFNRTTVRFEAVFKSHNSHLSDYETSEGNIITIYSLTPEEFIREKVNAFLSRYKIRDLYDIYFMLRNVENKSVSGELNKLIKRYKIPADEKNLRLLIIEGLVPTAQEMLDYIIRQNG